MTRRPQRWQAEKARTAKALRELPKCAAATCDKRAMGTAWVRLKNGEKQLQLLCSSHAQKAQIAQRGWE